MDKLADKLTTILALNADREAKARLIAEAIRIDGNHRWVGLYDVDGQNGLVSNIAWSGPAPPAFPTFPITKGLTSKAIAAKKTINIGDVASDPAYLTALNSTQSEIIVPVFGPSGAVVGTIDVESERLNAFGPIAQESLERYANILAVFWNFALSESSKYEPEASRLRLDRQNKDLEILKVLHAAGLERWKDRRENEWKLNYAIWAGIAALDGVLLLHGNKFSIPWWVAAGAALLGILSHLAYIWPAIERAICEIEMQNEIELAMRLLIDDTQVQGLIKPKHLGGAISLCDERGKAKKWLWKHYGLIAPLAFTAALLTLTVFLTQKH
jgi:GAF domain-containing protein